MPETYHGWVNKASWSVYTWLANDYDGANYYEQLVRTAPTLLTASQRIQACVVDASPLTSGMYADLLTLAFQSVAWVDVARAFDSTGKFA